MAQYTCVQCYMYWKCLLPIRKEFYFIGKEIQFEMPTIKANPCDIVDIVASQCESSIIHLYLRFDVAGTLPRDAH